MALATLDLMKSEGRLDDNIGEPDVQPFIDHSSREIQRIFDSLDAYGNDIFNLKDDYYDLSYSDLPALIAGSGTDYDTLITAIDAGLTGAGQDALTTANKNLLIQMARDFQKAETLWALSFSVIPMGLRPTAKGGFVRTLPQNASGGDIDILGLADLKQVRDYYYEMAQKAIGPYLFDHDARDDNPAHFTSEAFSLTVMTNPHVENESKLSYREKRTS